MGGGDGNQSDVTTDDNGQGVFISGDFEALTALFEEFFRIYGGIDVGAVDTTDNVVDESWVAAATDGRAQIEVVGNRIAALDVDESYQEVQENLAFGVSAAWDGIGFLIQAEGKGSIGLVVDARDRLAESVGYLSKYRDAVEGVLEREIGAPGSNGTSSGSGQGAGSSVPLYSSNVSDFSKGVVRASAGQLEAANRELDRVIDSGQQVISCQYGPSDPEAQTGYQTLCSIWALPQ